MLMRIVMALFIISSFIGHSLKASRIPPRVSKPKSTGHNHNFWVKHPRGINPIPPESPFFHHPSFIWDGYYFYRKPLKKAKNAPIKVIIH